MITVNMHEAKSRLSELVAAAEAGEEIVICRSGVEVAEIRKRKPSVRSLKVNPKLKPLAINYDPTEPLQPGEWPEDLR